MILYKKFFCEGLDFIGQIEIIVERRRAGQINLPCSISQSGKKRT